jgi:hypothetical protein
VRRFTSRSCIKLNSMMLAILISSLFAGCVTLAVRIDRLQTYYQGAALEYDALSKVESQCARLALDNACKFKQMVETNSTKPVVKTGPTRARMSHDDGLAQILSQLDDNAIRNSNVLLALSEEEARRAEKHSQLAKWYRSAARRSWTVILFGVPGNDQPPSTRSE